MTRLAALFVAVLPLFGTVPGLFAQEAAPPVAPVAPPLPAAPVQPQAPAAPVAPPAPAAPVAPQTPAAQPKEETPPRPPAAQAAPAPIVQGIVLNFKDASLDAVLTYLSETAGLTVMRETPVEGRVTIESRLPLSLDDSITVLNSVMKEKGYASVRVGKVLKVFSLGDAAKRPIPVRAGSNPDAIVPTDEVITQIIPLRTIDAVKLKQDLAPLIPATASLGSNAAGNALILTDISANVRRIAEIVRALDSQMAIASEVRVFPLKYANATSAARLITDIFREDTTQQGVGGGFRGRFFGGFGGQGGAGAGQTQDDQARRAPRVVATADDRTNTVVVTGPSDSLNIAASVLKELDSNTTEAQGIMTYPLRNGQAARLATVLNNLFGTTQQSRTATTVGGAAGGQRTGGGFQTQPLPGVSTAAQQSAAGLLGQVYTVADADTNSLMIMTSPKNFDQVRQILKDLDRPVPQVLIKVLLAEVTHDNTLDLGAEFSVLNLRAGGAKGSQLFTDVGAATPGANLTGGLVAKVVESDYTATLHALEKVGKLDVLSRPYILTSDNQKATITVGQSVPLITSSNVAPDTGRTTNIVQYRDIGIILNVTPHINPEGLVILDVAPEISALSATTVPISDTAAAPVIDKRTASSRVAIRDGQTIVIGGLIQDQKTLAVKRVPLLGRIPVLGWLFSRKTTVATKTELLIFLTPQVATDEEVLSRVSADESAAGKLSRHAVEPGTFDEYMKHMQKATSGEKK